jgi:HD domain
VPALVGAALLVTVAPESDWSDPVVIGALAVLSGLAHTAEQRLGSNRVFFGATLAIALVALGVAGPVPALLVWLVPDLLARFVERVEDRLTPAFVANLGGYLLGVVAGSLLLELGGSQTGAGMAPALLTAGLAMAALNFGFARLTFAPFYQHARVEALVRDEFTSMMPAVLGMLVVGDITAILVDPLGGWALLILPVVILMPRFAIERIARSTSVAKLDRAEAMQVYVAAICDVLGLSREDREQLACAADLIEPINGDTSGINGFDWGSAHVPGAAMLALHAGERWAGTGWPAGLPADAIPYGSRILAVAQAWTDLTAKGTPELTQAEAMLSLAAQADTEFDPAIVDAALHVVADEAGFSRDPDFQPKLHRMPLPRTLRRGALPTVMPRLVDVSLH